MNDMKIKSITLGMDPEFFLVKNGVSTTAPAEKIPGSKKEPFAIGNGITVHPDNVTLEIGVTPFVWNEEVLLESHKIQTWLQSNLDYVEIWLKDKYNCNLGTSQERSFTPAQLEADERCLQFGCDPDLDAYSGGIEAPVVDAQQVGRARFAGGHIHIGYDKSATKIPEFALVQLIEAFVMFPTAINDRYYIGNMRRSFYGRPGAFRIKPYGFEYRTPSNYWVINRDAWFLSTIATFVMFVLNHEDIARELYDMVSFDTVKDGLMGMMVNPDEHAQALVELRTQHIDTWINEVAQTSKKKSIDSSPQPVFGGGIPPAALGRNEPRVGLGANNVNQVIANMQARLEQNIAQMEANIRQGQNVGLQRAQVGLADFEQLPAHVRVRQG